VRPAYDRGVEREVRRFFDDYGTVRFENYAVGALRDAPQAVERGGVAGPEPASSRPAAAGGPPHRDDRAGAPDARHRNAAPRGDRAPGAPPSGGGR